MAGRMATDEEAFACAERIRASDRDRRLNVAVGDGDAPSRIADLVKTSGQRLYAYQNGYGASVIRSSISYGHEENKWELAIICATRGTVIDVGDLSTWALCYSTPIASDVIGWLTGAEVDALLDQIEALPTRTG